MINHDSSFERAQYKPYFSIFHKNTGQFIRGNEPDSEDDVFWSEECPEMLDISITGMCNRECDFCYRNSKPDGNHLPVGKLRFVLDQIKDNFICQIALGGGNPPLHPEFPEILRMIREDYGIVPNYTYNGCDLSDEGLDASEKYCGAVAVSWYDDEKRWFAETTRLIIAGIKTNAHFVLSSKSIKYATRILNGELSVPDGLNAIVFLTHKPVGKGKESDCLVAGSEELRSFLNTFSNHKHGFKVGFDSCFASAIVEQSEINPIYYDYCEAGRFSAFISEDLFFYPCSFAEQLGGINLEHTPLVEAWETGKQFVRFRSFLQTTQCDCDFQSNCRGGCPIDGRAFCTSPLKKR
ncbi:MAG: radical SAM protein [Candidatus Latescibacteria bacterium]|jgi:radical SAM protein with 4Fe4S-binding SPASM domain|nr:radical SAM protein [Candidatus Latescibacterota bacterium]